MESKQSEHLTQASFKSDESVPTKSSEDTIKNQFIQAILNDPDLPGLGSSISRIVQLSSLGEESIQQLSYFVLSDVSLTQKILRLANSIAYNKSNGSKPITNITKSIFILGFDSIRTCALAMLLVDKLSGKQAEHVRTELIAALAASAISRELALRSPYSDAIEEIAVIALFKNIGRLILAAFDPDLYQQMITLINQGTHTPAQASIAVLGLNLEVFTKIILKEWHIPVSIIQGLESNSLRTPKNKLEWVQQAAEFSQKAAPIALGCTTATEASNLQNQLLTRFGRAFNLDKSELDQLLKDAARETQSLLKDSNLLPDDNSQAQIATTTQIGSANVTDIDLLGELIITTDDKTEASQVTQRHPSGKPYNSAMLLLTGIQDTVEIMTSGSFKIDDLMTLILETYYTSLGFHFITVCLKDIKLNQFRARNSLGQDSMHYQNNFKFPTQYAPDLFHLAMQKNTDLIITDSTKANVRELVPGWLVKLKPTARSFMILPLIVNKVPIGLIYADRDVESPEGMTNEEIRLIKTLKGQALTALKLK